MGNKNITTAAINTNLNEHVSGNAKPVLWTLHHTHDHMPRGWQMLDIKLRKTVPNGWQQSLGKTRRMAKERDCLGNVWSDPVSLKHKVSGSLACKNIQLGGAKALEKETISKCTFINQITSLESQFWISPGTWPSS
jgi:hypothetical protein